MFLLRIFVVAHQNVSKEPNYLVLFEDKTYSRWNGIKSIFSKVCHYFPRGVLTVTVGLVHKNASVNPLDFIQRDSLCREILSKLPVSKPFTCLKKIEIIVQTYFANSSMKLQK